MLFLIERFVFVKGIHICALELTEESTKQIGGDSVSDFYCGLLDRGFVAFFHNESGRYVNEMV